MSNVDKKSVEGQVPVRLCNYTDVYNGDRITPALDLMAATASPEQVRAFRLLPGDVIITKDSEDPSDIGVPAFVEHSAPDLVCGYHLAVLRPFAGQADGRYLYWAMASRSVGNYLSANATGITRYGLRTDSIASTPIPWWPVTRQQAIADFLDAETARIDALIARTRRLIELLDERAATLRSRAFAGVASETQPLKRFVTKIGSGKTPRGGSDSYVSDGVLFLRSQNVRNGSVATEDAVFIDAATDSEMARTRVQQGDVLLNITGGSIGRCAPVGPEHLPANVSQHVCIVRPRPGVDPVVLHYALRTPEVRDEISLVQVGGNREGLNFEQVGHLPVRLPIMPAEFNDLRAELALIESGTESLRLSLSRQLELLTERRQALITAAVTGELVVPGVSA